MGPDLGIRLESLLDLRVQRTGLDSDDLRRGVGVVGDGRAAFRAEDSVDILARGALARPRLGGTAELQLVFWDDGNEG